MVPHCAKIVFSQSCRDVKHEVFGKKIAFLFLSFYVGDRETEQKKKLNGERPKKTYKNSVF